GRGRRDGSNRGVVIRLVFMGTPEFALPSLEAALAASDVAAVVTRPDAPQGRGQRVTPPPVAAVASQYGLEVLQPASLKAPEHLARLREAGRAPRRPQDPAGVTLAPKLSREDARLRWTGPAIALANLVRALDPWPVAYTEVDGVPLKIWRAAALPEAGREAPATVVRSGDEGPVVATGAGRLLVLEVQPPSGRRMTAAEYLRGHPIAPGTVLGAPRADAPAGPPGAAKIRGVPRAGR